MSWQDFIEKSVGDKRIFTNDEVRSLLLEALKYECDNWAKSEMV